MPFTQENRSLLIDTPLGKDVLLLSKFSGTERISDLFNFHLELISENRSIAFEDIIGKAVTISVVLADGGQRYFNGIVSRFSQGRDSGEANAETGFSHYTADIVPWFWLLDRTVNSRIFQELTVKDIIEKIFSEKNFKDYKFLLHGKYRKRDYCVQYRETDFNFASRLLEEEGIYYFFEHEDKKHTMVIADSPGDHKSCPHQETARYQISAGASLKEDMITSLEMTKEIRAGKYTLNDFNFETPATDLKVEAPGQKKLGPGKREIYEHPGRYGKRADGDSLANIRMQEEEAAITMIKGSSECRAFASGYKFDLKDYYREDMNNRPYVLTSIQHEAEQAYVPGAEESAFTYRNSFSCIPFDIPYRPQRNTRRSVVEGVQTAIVVGPKGEEIYTDEHGRVKVQFHWDREGKRDENSSCWIRVSQNWAGAGWGAMIIPRIGHEVIVDFEEGDPDRPIITGRVYHGINKPPYKLPDEKTKSTIKSDSSKGGGGSNELRFEDAKGSEEIYLHGQKDWTIAIENDKNQTIGNNETLSVGNNRVKKVGVNQTETIGSNMTQTVGSNKAETITIAKALTIGGAYQVSVGAAMNETIGGAKAEEIGGIKSVNVGANSSENIGSDKSVDAGKDISESASRHVSISSGEKMNLSAGDDFTVTGQKNGVIEIKEQLTIKVGKASITLKKNGDITIEGKNINTKGSGNIVMKAKKILEN